MVGPQARFVGELSGDEDIQIDGAFEGTVRAERRVVVGTSGDVKGDLLARVVVVGGKVEGQIVARERAELLGSAVVLGAVTAPRVVIAEGARLEGKVTMAAAAQGAAELELSAKTDR